MLSPHEALNKIAEKVLLQAMYDYVRLQHVNGRKKTYLREAFLNAVDLFHDPEYRLAAFKIDDSNEMNLTQFLMLATDRENVNLEALHSYLQKESREYWTKKDKDHMQIPDIITIDTTPWTVEHKDGAPYYIDFDATCIYVNRKTDGGKVDFLQAVLDILFDQVGISTSMKKRREFAVALRQTLKLNNNFK